MWGTWAENSQYSHTQMVLIDSDPLEREGTAELKNDPRFFAENVIDKRLAAFEALAIVMEILAVEGVKLCFELATDFEYVGDQYFVGVVQVFGFTMMISVMFASMVATAVLSLQLFFTIRLMTASPTGFDKAARFYQDSSMWRWRERAIFGVKYSLVCFMFSTGCMLCVKFWLEGKEEGEASKEEHGHEVAEHMKEREYFMHQVFATGVFCIFSFLTVVMWCLIRTHQRVFDLCYGSLDICHNELNRHLVTERMFSERLVSHR